MHLATLGAGRTTGAIPFRAAASLAACDAVFVDLDAIAAEYTDGLEDTGPVPLFDVAASTALLADARRWREALADFMRIERLVLVGWTDTPVLRVHTLHDIVPFGVADLLPRLAPQVERLAAPEAFALDCGAPFDRFFAALGTPGTTGFAIRALRGESLARTSSDAPAALYVLQDATHVVFAPIAAGPDRAARVEAGITTLVQALCGARHSTFLPSWARRIALPGEAAAQSALESVEAEIAVLRRRADAARGTLDAIRRVKAIVGGSPAQAAAAASERLRLRGARLLRDFEHENGFVVGLDARTTLLLAFGAADDATLAVRADAMLARYRHEFDGEAALLLVSLPTADGAPTLPPALRSGPHAACTAQAFLDALLDDDRPLPLRMQTLVTQSTRTPA